MVNDVKVGIIPPVMPGIFTMPPYDDGPPALLGGFCPACKTYYFPRPVRYCRTCLGPLNEAIVGTEGTIFSFTIVRKKAPLGLPIPYAAGFVDLKESGLRIFCLLDSTVLEKLRIGLPVRLVVNILGYDSKGSPCLRPYFTPVLSKKDPGGNEALKVEV